MNDVRVGDLRSCWLVDKTINVLVTEVGSSVIRIIGVDDDDRDAICVAGFRDGAMWVKASYLGLWREEDVYPL